MYFIHPVSKSTWLVPRVTCARQRSLQEGKEGQGRHSLPPVLLCRAWEDTHPWTGATAACIQGIFWTPLNSAAASVWEECHSNNTFPSWCILCWAHRENHWEGSSFTFTAPSPKIFRFRRMKWPSLNKIQKTGYWFPVNSESVVISIYRCAIECLDHLSRQPLHQQSNNWS